MRRPTRLEPAVAGEDQCARDGRPDGHRLPHLPALDGLRAMALVAVLLFHSELGWAQGGYLGVTTFFVLSGFLITGLLLRERDTTGGVRLRNFWGRRARRLLPAVLVLIGLVAALSMAGAAFRSRTIFGDGVASSVWMANWRFVLAHRSYAALFSAPSPFEHTWSLAVEEQVYVLLPLLVLVALGRATGRARRRRLAIVIGAGIAVSTLTAAWIHGHGGGGLHEYYGTDARAAEPLVGALLAVALVGRGGLRQSGRMTRAALDAAGVAGAAVLVVMIAGVSQYDDLLYRGGFLAAALASAAVVAAATQPGLVGRVLGTGPLPAVGRVSYGAYLFHWPLFLWLTPQRTGLDGARLLLVRSGSTLVLAVVSHGLVELPVRRGRITWPVAAPTWGASTVALLGALALATAPSVAASSSLFAAAPERLLPPPVPAPAVAAVMAAPAAPTATAATNAGGNAPPTTAAPSAAAATATRATTPPAAGPNPFAGPATQPVVAPPVPQATTTDTRLRIAIVGDSMARALARGMAAWAGTRNDVVVYDVSTPGCPLSRGGGLRRFPDGGLWEVNPACEWWGDSSSARYQNFVAFRPDVVVMQDAMNEVPDRKTTQWSDYRHTGQPLFDQWLLSEYRAAVKTFSSGGGKVLILNAVCADWNDIGGAWPEYTAGSDGDHRVASLNTTTSGVAATGAKVADFDSEVCPNGKFTQTVAGVSNARPDGYHLSDAAATAVASQWLGPMALQLRSPTSVASLG